MRSGISWQAFTRIDRQEAIRIIQDTISNNDGCIMNFNMLSDLALSLSIEIEEDKVLRLYKALGKKVSLSEFDKGSINQQSKKERLIFMNVTFSRGEGKLKNKIPEVPG